ncbi:hypothetical protein [Bacillus sp. RS11]|uniref:spr1630 family ClpXP-sensitive toxin n=1 Tax=Lysinibacillus sp. RS11 TaxID=3242682 RepID=UPI0035C67B78
MENYKLEDELNQKIVDGLMEGYREYLEVRREKSRSMKVSSAYAWVKGNHIDDQVAKSCESYGVKSKLAKAGLTWQYLQFNQDEEKIMFIMKNAKYFNEEQVDQGKDAKGVTRSTKMSYMTKLMEINLDVDFGNIETENASDSVQLELIEEHFWGKLDTTEIEKTNSKYDRFYIITYEIDENQLISKISLLMPNPVNNKAYLIDDLIKYVTPSNNVVIDDELKDALSTNMDESYDAFKFDIALKDDAEEFDIELKDDEKDKEDQG